MNLFSSTCLRPQHSDCLVINTNLSLFYFSTSTLTLLRLPHCLAPACLHSKTKTSPSPALQYKPLRLTVLYTTTTTNYITTDCFANSCYSELGRSVGNSINTNPPWDHYRVHVPIYVDIQSYLSTKPTTASQNVFRSSLGTRILPVLRQADGRHLVLLRVVQASRF